MKISPEDLQTVQEAVGLAIWQLWEERHPSMSREQYEVSEAMPELRRAARILAAALGGR
jgi:hypothetical protein